MCPKIKSERDSMRKVPYSSTIESLIYAMMCTQSDIYYAVGLVSRYQSNPGQKYWQAVKKILRYLRATTNYRLCYHGSDLQLVGYSDVE